MALTHIFNTKIFLMSKTPYKKVLNILRTFLRLGNKFIYYFFFLKIL